MSPALLLAAVVEMLYTSREWLHSTSFALGMSN